MKRARRGRPEMVVTKLSSRSFVDESARLGAGVSEGATELGVSMAGDVLEAYDLRVEVDGALRIPAADSTGCAT